MQRRSGCLVWFIIIAAIIVFFLTWQYVDYRLQSQTLPTGMKIAGLSVGGMTREQALNMLEVAFSAPLRVTYRDRQLSLSPDSVALRYDAEATVDKLDATLNEQRGATGFLAHILRRQPEPVNVPVAVSYSEEQLNSFLNRIATQYDSAPQEPMTLPESLAFRSGTPGSQLDIAASREKLAQALVSATQEQVDLVVEVEEAPPMDLDMLGQLLQGRLERHEGLTAGIFVKDLQSGDELTINANVAYSGLSVLKIAILEEAYRALDQPPSPETRELISDTMTNSGNSTANLLLRDVIDAGDSYQGAEILTASMNRLGLRNTFMAAPYDIEEGDTASTIVTPANSRTDITTNPDATKQTTPLDVGLLLEMIYQCSEEGGTLRAVYGDTITVDECNQMIEWMSRNRIDSLIEAGVPLETQVAHKEGLAGDTHADAGLVFSSGGDFVLVIFLYRPEWLEWDESAPLMTDIATAAYNYFNPVQ